MSISFSMGFSCGCGDDFEKRESEVPLIEETRENRHKCGMDTVQHHVVEVDAEFWPVEHPMEPQDEDRPVKCPMPASSVINDGRMSCEERFGESLRKRTELAASTNKEGSVVDAAVPTIRAVRKRHHTLTRDDQTIKPLARMPPLPPLPTHNITIYQMLQEFDEFES